MIHCISIFLLLPRAPKLLSPSKPPSKFVRMPRLVRTPTKMTPSNTKHYITPTTPATTLNIYLDHAKEYPLFAKTILNLVTNATNNLVAKLYLQEAVDEINKHHTNTHTDDTATSVSYIQGLIRNAQEELHPYSPPGLPIPTAEMLHYCGDRYCDWGCGVQSCGGCIDVCRCSRYFG